MFCMHWIDLRVPAVILVTLLAIAAPAVASPLAEEFVGKFRGSVTGSAGEIEGDFNMVSAAKRNGFTVAWSPNNSAEFEASDRKNVFHARSRGRLLEGVPAFWARLQDGKLLVYSMQINSQGGYDIYTFIYAPVADGLDMTVRHLRGGSEPLESSARLKRYDR